MKKKTEPKVWCKHMKWFSVESCGGDIVWGYGIIKDVCIETLWDFCPRCGAKRPKGADK